VGPARADIYWGAGDDAGRIAERTRQQGRFVILLPRELDMIAAGKTMPLPQPKPLISHEIIANKGDGDRADGYQKDRAKPQIEKTDKAPTRNVQKAEGQKKSLGNLRQQEQSASRGTVKLASREIVVNKEADRPHGNPNDRTKLAEKTQAGKASMGNAHKAEDHKKSFINLRQQAAERASKDTAKVRSHEMVSNKGEADRPHGYRQNRTKLAENTEAEKAPSGNAEKAGDHKKSLVDQRQQQQPASKGAKPRSREGGANKEDGGQAHGHRKDRAMSPAEKTQAENVPTVHAQKAEDHKKSLSNLRQQTHPAGKGTTNPRS
jgi:hypothetical protein